MKRLGTLSNITATIDECRQRCQAEGSPFHADALAAALGIPYETVVAYASGKGETARLLKAALQECTASVISHALAADPKSHGLWMFYLRNRVEGIEETAARLREKLPDAVIACAHGQMTKEELSDIWASLVAGVR